LTCTLSCDPTTASPRRECIVGQIHDEDTTPPIHLAVDLNREPGTLRLFARGAHGRLDSADRAAHRLTDAVTDRLAAGSALVAELGRPCHATWIRPAGPCPGCSG